MWGMFNYLSSYCLITTSEKRAYRNSGLYCRSRRPGVRRTRFNTWTGCRNYIPINKLPFLVRMSQKRSLEGKPTDKVIEDTRSLVVMYYHVGRNLCSRILIWGFHSQQSPQYHNPRNNSNTMTMQLVNFQSRFTKWVDKKLCSILICQKRMSETRVLNQAVKRNIDIFPEDSFFNSLVWMGRLSTKLWWLSGLTS